MNEKDKNPIEERIFELDTKKIPGWPEGVTIAKPASEIYVRLERRGEPPQTLEVRISGKLIPKYVEYTARNDYLVREAYNLIIRDFESGNYVGRHSSVNWDAIQLKITPNNFNNLRELFAYEEKNKR